MACIVPGADVNLFQSVILGLVQGLTEFLPISSTAHLRIVPALAGWDDPGAAFSAVIQLGTLVAVLLYFRRDIAEMISSGVRYALHFKERETLDDHTRAQGRMAWFIMAGSIPIGVAGLVFQHRIETSLRSLYIIGASLIVLAVVLAFAERVARHNRKLSSITLSDSMFMGCAQVLSLVPGVSRSGVTMTAGLFRDLNRETAARFSFLLSIPAVLASGLFELRKVGGDVGQTSGVSLLAGTLAAAIVGYLSIGLLLRFLQKRSTAAFIAYRIVLGAMILGLAATAVIS